MRVSRHLSAPLASIASSRTFASLRGHRNFQLYFYGQSLSMIGTWLQSAAMAWLVLQLTHSAIDVGLLTFWQFGPYLVLGLFGGAIADRLDHRRTLQWMQAVLGVCSAAMAVLTLFHVILLWEAFAIAMVRGLALILNNPSRQAFIFQMVGRDELPNAIALNSSLVNATRIIGPALAGVLIAAFGVGICFSIDAISYIAVIVALALMRASEFFTVEHRAQRSVLSGTVEGLRYIKRTPIILLALVMFAIVCMVSINFNVLLPLVASNTLHSGAETYGILTSCFGAGALIGALITASVGRANWRMLVLSLAGFGAGELIFAPQRTLVAAVIVLLLTGVCYTIFTSSTNAIVQLCTPGYLQGRVAGMYSYIFGGTGAIGALIAGRLADLGGTPLAFTVAGGAALACAIFGIAMRSRVPMIRPESRSATLAETTEVQRTSHAPSQTKTRPERQARAANDAEPAVNTHSA